MSRLHDTDRNGWWLFYLGYIPGVNIVGLPFLYLLCCMRGTTGDNRFGPAPVPTSHRLIVIEWYEHLAASLKLNRRMSRKFYWCKIKNILALIFYIGCLISAICISIAVAEDPQYWTKLDAADSQPSQKAEQEQPVHPESKIMHKLAPGPVKLLLNKADEEIKRKEEARANGMSSENAGTSEPPPYWLMFSIAVAAFCVVFRYRDIISRLHDVGKSGWWILAGIVPYANIAFYPVMMRFCMVSGDTEGNRFGPNPKVFEEQDFWLSKSWLMHLVTAWGMKRRLRVLPRLFSRKSLCRRAARRYVKKTLRTFIGWGIIQVLAIALVILYIFAKAWLFKWLGWI